jgi:hypothetical protein
VVEDKEDPLVSSLQCLFDVAQEAGQGRPLIIFIQVWGEGGAGGQVHVVMEQCKW